MTITEVDQLRLIERLERIALIRCHIVSRRFGLFFTACLVLVLVFLAHVGVTTFRRFYGGNVLHHAYALWL